MARPLSVTDEEILGAAEKVMAARGPSGFSMSEVAREVSLSRSAVSLRFPALKQDVFRIATERFAQEIGSWHYAVGAAGLLEIATRIGRMVSGRSGFARFMLRFSENLEDPVGQELEIARGQILRDAVAQAMPPMRVTKQSAVDGFMAHISGSLLAWRATPDGDAEKFLRERTEIWLEMVGCLQEGDGR